EKSKAHSKSRAKRNASLNSTSLERRHFSPTAQPRYALLNSPSKSWRLPKQRQKLPSRPFGSPEPKKQDHKGATPSAPRLAASSCDARPYWGFWPPRTFHWPPWATP